MLNTTTIQGGLYLVIDPAKGLDNVLPAVQQAIAGGVDIIQIWDDWQHEQQKETFIAAICSVAHSNNIPVLINENWQLMLNTALDGVHFDETPVSLELIRQQVGHSFFCGITCGNELQKVQWAIDNGIDYISFCSMFPSDTANSCELVSIETVQAARRMTHLPIFVAGGITSDNMDSLATAGMDGVAVISGIMNAPDPQQSTQLYKQAFRRIKQSTV